MNENLSAALLRAGLTVEDVAARLEVDPKTVRRWLDGRVPFLRHRWALAGMLSAEEMDLWPGLRAASSRPADLRAIYPRLDAVPRGVWLSMLGSAEREIDILDAAGPLLGGNQEAITLLSQRVCAGVRTRICLAAGPDRLRGDAATADLGAASAAALRKSRRWGAGLMGDVQIRHHRAVAYNLVYRADDQLLVSHRVYGATRGGAPVLRLQHGEAAALAPVYIAEFERVWAESSADNHQDLPNGGHEADVKAVRW